jgi:WD40 repeat protein
MVLAFNNTFYLWNLEKGGFIKSRAADIGWIHSLSPDGETVLYTYIYPYKDNFTYESLNIINGKSRSFVEAAAPFVFSPDGRKLITNRVMEPNGVALTDAYTEDTSKDIILTNKSSTATAFSIAPNEKKILFFVNIEPKNVLGILDLKTNSITTLNGYNEKKIIRCLALSPDGHFAASAPKYTAEIILWDAVTGKSIHTLKYPGSPTSFETLTFSTDGHFLFAEDIDLEGKLWDVKTGKFIRSIENAKFSPNGRHVAEPTKEGNVRLKEMRTDKLLLTLATDKKEWIAVTPEGFYNASPNGYKLAARIPGHKTKSAHKKFYRPDLIEQLLKGDPDGRYKSAVEHLLK